MPLKNRLYMLDFWLPTINSVDSTLSLCTWEWEQTQLLLLHLTALAIVKLRLLVQWQKSNIICDDVRDDCLDICTIDHHWWYNMIWQGRVERWVIDMMPQYMVLRSTWTHTHSPFPRLVPCSRTRRTSIVWRTSIWGSLFQKWILRRLWPINSWSAKVGWVDNFWCSVCKNLEKIASFMKCETHCVWTIW